ERLWRALRRAGASEAAGAGLDALGAGEATPTTVSFGGARLTGTLDHVAAGASRPARIARYKHGKLDAQLGLRDLFYALAAEEMAQRGQAAEVTRVSLANGEVKPLAIAGQRQRLEQEASAALAGLAREDYTPRPAPRICATCPFALICPA
ncbi:MAG: PD-(D/E)XK nuclease family protein, partial [Chloroflexota bacterium]|nr:PD-(D/E)XK nuclease family protein [Chloroflexota bacterium]